MPKRKTRVEDSDDDVRIFEKEARLADSDEERPLFGPKGLAEKLAKKIRQQEEEQESQQPLAPEEHISELDSTNIWEISIY